uniref:Uncharacterized protein n=1 Tax=Oryza nivara TaxID=4536 RepID=A0A0E0IJM2_ORYNI
MQRSVRRTHRVIGDGRGRVEHAVAAVEGGADGVVVEEVGLAEDQPLVGAVQRLQVGVLRVIYTETHHVDGRRQVKHTATQPLSSSSLTSHDAMYPAAPVTHTVWPCPGGSSSCCCAAAAAAAASSATTTTVIVAC